MEYTEILRSVQFYRRHILLTGPTGTGKSHLAQQIHNYIYPNNDKLFMVFNTIAFSHDHLSSSLFGYERGSFTGALVKHQGLLTNERYGTLLIDEFAELSLDEQAKLLVSLDENAVLPLGGNESLKIKPLVIVATNRDIYDEKIFRHDLIERFAIRIKLPAFNELSSEEQRKTINEVIDAINKSGVFSSHKNSKISLENCALNFIQKSQWPRNVREIKNLLTQAAVFKLINFNENRAPENIKINAVFLQSVAIKLGMVQYVPIEKSIPKWSNNEYLSSVINDLKHVLGESIHDSWSSDRIKNGWKFGEKRDDVLRTNPCLVHFDNLPQSEQDIDKNIAGRVIFELLNKANIRLTTQFFMLCFLLSESEKKNEIFTINNSRIEIEKNPNQEEKFIINQCNERFLISVKEIPTKYEEREKLTVEILNKFENYRALVGEDFFEETQSRLKNHLSVFFSDNFDKLKMLIVESAFKYYRTRDGAAKLLNFDSKTVGKFLSEMLTANVSQRSDVD